MAIIDTSVIPYVSTFLFVFAVVFGLLSYSKVGEFSKRVNAIIALSVALLSTFYEPLVVGLQEFMPFAVIILIVLFFGVFIKKIVTPGNQTDALPLAATLGILLLILMVVGDQITSFLPGNFDPQSVLWIAGILIAILFFVAIYNHK